jgi:hypothetical protein
MDDATPSSRSVWPALIVAPLLALTHLSVGYSLVGPSCAAQTSGGLHGLGAVSLLLALAMTLLAWRAWARLRHRGDSTSAVTLSDEGLVESRPRFVALMATLVGALSTLVVAALWVPVWILSPCS